MHGVHTHTWKSVDWKIPDWWLAVGGCRRPGEAMKPKEDLVQKELENLKPLTQQLGDRH